MCTHYTKVKITITKQGYELLGKGFRKKKKSESVEYVYEYVCGHDQQWAEIWDMPNNGQIFAFILLIIFEPTLPNRSLNFRANISFIKYKLYKINVNFPNYIIHYCSKDLQTFIMSQKLSILFT